MECQVCNKVDLREDAGEMVVELGFVCNSCIEQSENVSGYCSIYCQFYHSCDQSC